MSGNFPRRTRGGQPAQNRAEGGRFEVTGLSNGGSRGASRDAGASSRPGRVTRLQGSGIRRIVLDFGLGLAVFMAFAGVFAIDRWQTLGSTGFSFWCESALAQEAAPPPAAAETPVFGEARSASRAPADQNRQDRVRVSSEQNAGDQAGGGDGSATMEGPEPSKISGRPLFADMTPPTALILLGLMFAALFAFNLAFFRHYRRKVSWQDGKRKIVGRSVVVGRSQ